MHWYQNICVLELDKKVLQSTENIQEGDNNLPACQKKKVCIRVQNRVDVMKWMGLLWMPYFIASKLAFLFI